MSTLFGNPKPQAEHLIAQNYHVISRKSYFAGVGVSHEKTFLWFQAAAEDHDLGTRESEASKSETSLKLSFLGFGHACLHRKSPVVKSVAKA